MTPDLKVRNRSISRARQNGSAVSFVFGIVFGLLISLGVVLYLNKAELPFSGVSTQADVPDLAPGPNQAPPDPNESIYSAIEGAEDEIAALNSNLNRDSESTTRASYYLQVGSFRNRDDAEQLRARLAFVGTESEIVVGQVNDMIVNRVRIGPFGNANQAYQARIPLTKGGFEATVVKD